jgi:hypothetical protein
VEAIQKAKEGHREAEKSGSLILIINFGLCKYLRGKVFIFRFWPPDWPRWEIEI